MRLASALAASLLLAAAAAAQVPYSLDIDPAGSNASWWANTSLGNVVGAPTLNFQFDGTIDVSLGAAGAPFGSGQFTGGDAFTIPPVLAGKIPNPIPFTPPLARIEIRNLHAGLHSGSFAIAANGSFSTQVYMTALSGEIFVDPWVGSTTITPVAGLNSDPFLLSGTFSEAAGQVVLDAPLDPVFPITGGISGSFGVNGDLHASAPVANYNMVLTVSPLTGGQTGSFDVTGGLPNSPAWLAYSLTGLGATPIGALGITLDLDAPAAAAGPTPTDPAGAVGWSLPIPAVHGLAVWFQACQAGLTSNVVATTIQ
ncbi:MAG: hypothetical protein D6702_03155 [Planctomycetota bacterium]|nr:MAG: hypothetical protein D6702_03155 [Planctomycetota bacterium]